MSQMDRDHRTDMALDHKLAEAHHLLTVILDACAGQRLSPATRRAITTAAFYLGEERERISERWD